MYYGILSNICFIEIKLTYFYLISLLTVILNMLQNRHQL